jgi:hypothetical protein
MTPDICKDLIAQLRQAAQPLPELYGFIQELGSDWSLAQLQLFLVCMDGIEVSDDDRVSMGEKSPLELLLAAVVHVVKSQGNKPIPAAQVVRLLPSQFVTTEAQIKALAKDSSELVVVGPGLLKLK